MISGEQPKVLITQDEDGNLIASEGFAELFGLESEFNWKLVRERDNLTKKSKDVKWMEWNEDRTLKAHHDTPAIGLSLLMSPFDESYTWLTTPITEIVEEREGYIKFNTQNSVYELWSNVEE